MQAKMAVRFVAVLTLLVAVVHAEVVDWRTKGAVPPVRSQGQSGASVSAPQALGCARVTMLGGVFIHSSRPAVIEPVCSATHGVVTSAGTGASGYLVIFVANQSLCCSP